MLVAEVLLQRALYLGMGATSVPRDINARLHRGGGRSLPSFLSHA